MSLTSSTRAVMLALPDDATDGAFGRTVATVVSLELHRMKGSDSRLPSASVTIADAAVAPTPTERAQKSTDAAGTAPGSWRSDTASEVVLALAPVVAPDKGMGVATIAAAQADVTVI
jgi:hypothetical protein